VRNDERVLAVFAHPDDESIVAGGTLAACAAAGIEVALACATRGEGGVDVTGALAAGELGRVREAELRAACRELGIRRVDVLGLPDGGLREAAAELGDAVGRLLAAVRPSAVVTFGPEGLYWHPDHVAVHEATVAAAERSTTPVYFATIPEGAMRAFVDAAAKRGLETDLWGIDPDAFGAPAAAIRVTVELGPHFGAKRRALRRHATQLGASHSFVQAPDDVARALLGTEHFATAPAGGRDDGWLATALSPSGVVATTTP
jgi:N-acetyl-1-D-myo-inositol-2-amino-2-deoxy-alpha-D-glucopyranoside deacetylase